MASGHLPAPTAAAAARPVAARARARATARAGRRAGALSAVAPSRRITLQLTGRGWVSTAAAGHSLPRAVLRSSRGLVTLLRRWRVDAAPRAVVVLLPRLALLAIYVAVATGV